MVWTTPITWALGETPTAAELNSQIVENMLMLENTVATHSGRAIETTGSVSPTIIEEPVLVWSKPEGVRVVNTVEDKSIHQDFYVGELSGSSICYTGGGMYAEENLSYQTNYEISTMLFVNESVSSSNNLSGYYDTQTFPLIAGSAPVRIGFSSTSGAAANARCSIDGAGDVLFSNVTFCRVAPATFLVYG